VRKGGQNCEVEVFTAIKMSTLCHLILLLSV
jgi:hypothetical protein